MDVAKFLCTTTPVDVAGIVMAGMEDTLPFMACSNSSRVICPSWFASIASKIV
jgi:hypothetical protein